MVNNILDDNKGFRELSPREFLVVLIFMKNTIPLKWIKTSRLKLADFETFDSISAKEQVLQIERTRFLM